MQHLNFFQNGLFWKENEILSQRLFLTTLESLNKISKIRMRDGGHGDIKRDLQYCVTTSYFSWERGGICCSLSNAVLTFKHASKKIIADAGKDKANLFDYGVKRNLFSYFSSARDEIENNLLFRAAHIFL